jgi:ferredoxin
MVETSVQGNFFATIRIRGAGIMGRPKLKEIVINRDWCKGCGVCIHFLDYHPFSATRAITDLFCPAQAKSKQSIVKIPWRHPEIHVFPGFSGYRNTIAHHY